MPDPTPDRTSRCPETTLITAGRPADEPGLPLNEPIMLASNFRSADGGDPTGRVYSREDATPGWEALEEVVGALEGGHALAVATGMAAVATVLELLPAGARVVAPTDSYVGVRALLADGAQLGRWRVELVDVTDTDAVVAAAAGADVLWLESPTNPMLDVADLPALCRARRDAGALVVVDNTFATPLLQRPLALGAHVVVRRVRYPGLPADPGHARAAAQMAGFGALLAFEVGAAATADAVCDTVRVIRSATSLGGVESTIEHRGKLAGQEHLPPGFLRLSVGCEHVEDLWADLDAALTATPTPASTGEHGRG